MLSRVAESIFWMGRYIERAESYARFIEVNLNISLDLPPGVPEQWLPLVYITGDNELYESLHPQADRESVIHFLTFSKENPSSILSCIEKARDNARAVRETISGDVFEQVNTFYHELREASETGIAQPSEFYRSIKRNSHLYDGILSATISHGPAYHFARMGKYLERADKATRLLDVKYFILLPRIEDIGSTLDILQWSAVLKSASALEEFLRKYGVLSAANIISFLVLDGDFPGAIRFCLACLDSSMRAITGSRPGTFSSEAEKRLGLLRSELDYTDIADIMSTGLHEYLDQLQLKLNNIGNAVHGSFFVLPAEQQMVQSQ